MSYAGPVTQEMKRRGKSYGNYRFRRFQALDDALQIFFHIQDAKLWVTTTDLITQMDWERTPTTMKRTRRICESLVRIGKISKRTAHGGPENSHENLYRILE